ncbi:MAG: Stk1 family PASTA domain-containing Ser/Thr kinase [Chloroflexi bacterium]|nr:MAG: Stk1 family PASTA domain-containing Ser/Thr kinase [Chloroflexota bacterium]
METVLLNNRYRLVELVGSGGMAVVYKGVDTLLQRRVAVKVLREAFASDPAFLTRFQREARAAANLDHPNIVTVYDVGQDGDRHYIVMEYVDGQDLKTLIRQKGHLSVDETLDIAIQVCAGVGHAHKASIIHCDIKPQNVLVTRDGRAKVTDFGIARALSESGLTESETVWGSPLYFSPEQALGEPPSPASDVYSIGIMMYEMLAGAPPFQAEKPAALALMHMREEPPPLAARNPQVPPQLEWIIRKVLAKEPAARYRTASQLAHVLEEYRERGEQMTGWQPVAPGRLPPTLPPVDYTAEAEPSPASRAASDRLTWVLAVIAFVAVVGLIPLWWGVYQVYSSPLYPLPTVTSPPLVTLTSAAQSVPVPHVVGMPVDEAQRRLREEGFSVLLEERYDPDADRGIVLEQSPAPDALAPLGSAVSIVVNGPGRELTMPGVVGYPVELVQEGLESDGLQVSVDKVWSTEPEGMVIAQEPERGTTIYTGDTVTLTVSGGVDIPISLAVNLADLVMLESAELRQETFQPGGMVAVALRWRALRAIDTRYVVFVHLIGPNGRLVAQQDVEPIIPTTTWAPGVEVVDPHQIAIPADQPPGRYQLRTGMYPQGQPSARLSVKDAGFTTAELDSILVTEIEIRP